MCFISMCGGGRRRRRHHHHHHHHADRPRATQKMFANSRVFIKRPPTCCGLKTYHEDKWFVC
jgi:hypothetical protein